MFCPKCGSQHPDNSAFCVKCGVPLGQSNPTSAHAASRPHPYAQPMREAYNHPADGAAYAHAYSAGYASPTLKKVDSLTANLTERKVAGRMTPLEITGILAAAVSCIMMLLRWVKIPLSGLAQYIGISSGQQMISPEFSFWYIGETVASSSELSALMPTGFKELFSSLLANTMMFKAIMLIGVIGIILVIIGVTAGHFKKKAARVSLVGFILCALFSGIVIAVTMSIDSTIASAVLTEASHSYADAATFIELQNLHYVQVTFAPIVCLFFSIIGLVTSFLTARSDRYFC